jgi:CheY-like chemotaxis protein
MVNPRILVIDDDAVLLQALLGTFECRLPNVRLDTCVSAGLALEQIRTTDYHAILCDLNMPVMNGLELLREVKKLKPWTPLLLMTGNDHDEFIHEAAQAGAYDFIKKPLNRDILVLAIKRALEVHQWRGERQKDTVLCLEGLPPAISVEAFRDWVAQFGTVLWVRLVLDAFERTGPSAYGYVEYASTEEAEHARRRLAHGARFQDRLDVSFCHEALQQRHSSPVRPMQP